MPDTVSELRVVISADTSQVESGLKSASQKVSSFGDSFKEGLALGAGFTAFTAGLELIGQGFASLKGAAIDFNQTVDSASASMSRFFTDTQSLNNSIANLNALAAKTPFAFEGLLVAQQRTIGAARSAEELKLNMDAIAVVAANTGRVSTANMERISLALGQMQSKGHLAGGELLQLTEAGVNMGEILAKHFNVSTAAIAKMASEGKISSQDVFAAMRENAADPRMREALDKMAKTWEGAWSTISDVGKTVIASTFRPMFDLLTEGAVAFADFIQTENFQVWAEALKTGFAGAVNGIKALFSALAPIGQAFATAFSQLTSGDFSGAFATIGTGLRSALGTTVGYIHDFATQMFGGGVSLIEELAGGILSGASGVLQGAIDAVASLIASFFIGNSPPPAGPLARITEGGANTATAWVDGFAPAIAKGVGQAAKTAAGTIDQLKVASIGIASQIRDIADQSQALDRVMRGLKGTIDSVKDGFTAQKQALQDVADATKERYAVAIQGVRDQIDTIKDAHEKSARAVQAQIDTIKDAYGVAIDDVRLKIDTIKESYDGLETAVQRQIDTVKDQYGAALDGIRDKITKITDEEDRQLAPLQKQLDALKSANTYLRERQDAERSIANAKAQQLQLDALGDPVLRAQLTGQLAGINQQQQRVDLAEQLAEAQKKLGAADTSPAEKLSLGLKIEQLKIQKQLADMVNTTKLSEATRQSALLDGEQKQLSVTRAIQDANQKIAEIPLEEKIGKIKDAATAALAPLQAQLKSLTTDQKAALDPLQDKLKALKAEEHDLLVPLQSRLKELQRDQSAALDPLQQSLKNIKAEQVALLAPLEDQLQTLNRESDAWSRSLSAGLKEIDRQQRETLAPLEAQLKFYQGQKDALTEQKQELDSIKARIQETIQLQTEAAKAAKGAGGAEVVGAPKGGISFDLDEASKAAAESIKKRGAELASGLKDGFVTWITANPLITGATIAGALFGAGQGAAIGASLGSVVPVIGTIIGGVLGAGIGAAIGGIAANQLAGMLQDKVEQIVGGPLVAAIKAKFIGLNAAFSEGGFGGLVTASLKILSDAVPRLGELFARWGGLAVDWAGKALPLLLAKLQEIQSGVLSWISTNAGPIGEKLSAWSLALVGWVSGAGLDLLSKLGNLIGDVLGWIGKNAKEIAGQLADWATAFVEWVGPKIPVLLEELGKLGVKMIDWIADKHGDVLDSLGKWAVEFVNWVAPKIKPLLEELGKLLVSLTDWAVKTALPAIVEQLSEWGKRFVDWVGPRIKPLLEELGAMGLAIFKWMGEEALPAINKQLLAWAGAFLGWIATSVVPSLAEKLGAILVAIGSWVAEKVTAVAESVKAIGGGILTGIQEGVSGALPGFWRWLQENFVDKIPDFIKQLLGIHSPSSVFMGIGANMVEGLRRGMEGRLPSIDKLISDVLGRFGGAAGSGMGLIQQIGALASGIGGPDFAKAAMAISASETGGGANLSEIGGTGAQGPFQFDPGGELRNFAKFLGVTVDQAGAIARSQPMLAAKWALEGYLGDAIKQGLSQGLTGSALANYGSRVGQRPYGDNWKMAGEWYQRLFPGYAAGGWAGLHGPELAWLGERGPEYVVPHSELSGGGRMDSLEIVVKISDREAERIHITGRQLAIRRGRVPSGSS